ncbi:MAG TPA: NYN domain-containing protein [bacterium]|nr:NYN domain-containing protein [bacterium]HPO11387.1 NYN domain-containing protein [bacterium]
MEKEITYVFIDSQNLNMSIMEQGWELDFYKFYIYLKDRFKISKAFLFIGFIDQNISLYKQLSSIGYKLIFKLVINNKDKVKGNVDAELVLQAMIEFNNYDKAIIVSGDGDFYCLIDYIEKNKKLLRLIIPNKYKYSSLLKSFYGQITFLNNMRHKLNKNEGHELRTKPFV